MPLPGLVQPGFLSCRDYKREPCEAVGAGGRREPNAFSSVSSSNVQTGVGGESSGDKTLM